MTWKEAELHPVQQWFNLFCENWLFAFLVAMAIQNFIAQAFIIPTTSMEPMLYGDRGWFQGDFVVVNKVSQRVRAPQRFDVTVFQFPRDELFRGGISTTPAVDEQGRTLDQLFIDPLVNRNFVKRLIVLPSETWFVRNGNAYIATASGAWRVARKPDDIQNAVWYRTYHSGAQAEWDQRVWLASGSATVSAAADQLRFVLPDSTAAIAFTQPLSNLFLKPGRVRVRMAHIGQNAQGPASGEIAPERGETVSPERPLMRLANGTVVDLWDASRRNGYQIERMKSEDLDSNRHGAGLNALMSENVGDWRMRITPSAVQGSVTWTFAQFAGASYALTLNAQGWSITSSGKSLATATTSIIGQRVEFGVVDDELQLAINDQIVQRWDVPPWAPIDDAHALSWTVSGQGSITCQVDAERDLHWSLAGIFKPINLAQFALVEAEDAAGATVRSRTPEERNAITAVVREALLMRLAMLRQRLPNLEWPEARDIPTMPYARVMEFLSQAQRAPLQGAMGISPETALTAPEDGYLLLGDNSPHSDDSRNWGYVPEANLRGRAAAVVFPPQRWRVIR